jgi:hypothetical protein
MKKITLAAALLALSVQSYATDWQELGASNKGSVYYLDLDSLSSEGDYVTAWIKLDARSDKSVAFRESKLLYKADCVSRKIGINSYTVYAPDSSVLESQSFTYTSWRDVSPESMGAAIYASICLAAGKIDQEEFHKWF